MSITTITAGNLLADWILLLSATPVVIFGVMYSTTAPWRRSAVGRMFIVLTACLLLFFLVVGLSLFMPDWYLDSALRMVLRNVGYSAMGFGLTVFLLTYLAERKSPEAITFPRSTKGTTMTQTTTAEPSFFAKAKKAFAGGAAGAGAAVTPTVIATVFEDGRLSADEVALVIGAAATGFVAGFLAVFYPKNAA